MRTFLSYAFLIVAGISASAADNGVRTEVVQQVTRKILELKAYEAVVGANKSPDEFSERFILDLYGTLLVTEKVTYIEYKSALQEAKHTYPPLTPEKYQQLISQASKPKLDQSQKTKESCSTHKSAFDDIAECRTASSDVVRNSVGIESFETKYGVTVSEHPYYGTVKLGSGNTTDFLTGFDPKNLKVNKNISPADLAAKFRPLDSSLPFDAEQILKAQDFAIEKDSTAATNMNADLGVRQTLSKVLRHSVITKDVDGKEQPSFVMISSGHAMAGLAELTKMTRTVDGKKEYLFDTSIYMPMGGWSNKTARVNVASKAGNLWANEIEETKDSYKANAVKSAGGVALALNGHRGDLDIFNPSSPTANIDPVKMLGTPEVFSANLRQRGLSRVVIVTEHFVEDPKKPNILPLNYLKNTPLPGHSTFDFANRDLFDYLSKLKKLGVDVVVVSGEQRTLTQLSG